MALPTAFANLVNPTGPELDSDLSACGVIGIIPCTVSGSANAIIMTPNANTPVPASNPLAPTVAAYGNYMRFSGVAGATNNGATTIQVGSLAALPAYKDTAAGPILTGGIEIVQNCAFEAVYDSALNGGGGGFHVYCAYQVQNTNIFPSGIGIQNANSTITGIFSPAPAGVPFTVVPANSVQEQLVTSGYGNVVIGDGLVTRFVAGVPSNVMFMPYAKAAGTVAFRVANPTAASIAAFTVTVGFQLLRTVP